VTPDQAARYQWNEPNVITVKATINYLLSAIADGEHTGLNCRETRAYPVMVAAQISARAWRGRCDGRAPLCRSRRRATTDDLSPLRRQKAAVLDAVPPSTQ